MPISGNTHALMYARLGVMRVGASRLDYFNPWVRVLINGTDRTANTRLSGATIQQTMDGTPDTANLRVEGFTPANTPSQGQEIKIYLGETTDAYLLFAGHILSVATTYEELPTNIVHDLSCVDYTWRLNARKVLRKWTDTSATTIITDLITDWTTGFTAENVAAGLPVLDEFTCTNEDVTDALDRVMARLGGYWYADYTKGIHAFLDADEATTPVTDSMHMGVDEVVKFTDLSQVRTRIWSRGGGSVATAAVAPGSLFLPVEDDSWYASEGGFADCGPQRIQYGGKCPLANSSTTLPPPPLNTPAAPAVAHANGAANTYVSGVLAEGTYRYKVSLVQDGVEGSTGAAGTLVIGGVAAPTNTSSVTLTSNGGGSMTNGQLYRYRFVYATANGETLPSSDGSDQYGFGDGSQQVTLSGTAIDLANIPVSPDGRVTARHIYRANYSAGDTFRRVGTINNNTGTTFTDTMSNATAAAQAAMPTAAATQSGQGQLSAITLGPSGTTARKIYRTERNGGTYKLLTTLNDNTTETYLDNTADASLGATLATESIGASAGDTTLRIVDSAKVPNIGWLYVGDNLIHYTGRTFASGPGTVTGIPASGVGAIIVNIPAGASVVVAPHLIGVFGIAYDIVPGDEVSVATYSYDADAADSLATLIGSGDGVVDDFIQDGRLSLVETQARGDAKLAEVKDPVTTITLKTRDRTFRVGRSTTFTLTNPSVSGTYKVQRVTISGIAEAGAAVYHFPLRSVELSSRRFSFESLLRQIKSQQ